MNPRRILGGSAAGLAHLLLPAAAAVPASATTPPRDATTVGREPSRATRAEPDEDPDAHPDQGPRGRLRPRGRRPQVPRRASLTFHIADPVRDLRTVSTLSEDGVTTVRLAQRHRGLPVVGAQYIVRMRDQGASNVVTGTSGRYFSALGVDVSHPLGFRFARLAALHALSDVRWKKAPVVTDAGNAIVPVGTGILTRHVTVTGIRPRATAAGAPADVHPCPHRQAGAELQRPAYDTRSRPPARA